MSKIMPDEVKEQLSQVERLQAYYNDSYELDEEDAKYLEQLDITFKMIHAEEERESAREKIRKLFNLREPAAVTQLIDDCLSLYGDFFRINNEVMRVIQEKRHTRAYMRAQRDGEHSAAIRALQSIDKLYDLYGTKVAAPVEKKLPKVKLTSNVSALKKLADE